MKKYEYKCVFIMGSGDKTTREMNEYGKQGWEFVSYIIKKVDII